MTNLDSLRTAKRKLRVRSKILRLKKYPRLSVFCSNKFIYGQVIDDAKGVTLAAASDKEVKDAKTKMDAAVSAGELLAVKALKKKVSRVTFDRGAYRYHGRVKAFAEGARKGGLKF